MDDLVYTKYKKPLVSSLGSLDSITDAGLPTLAQLQEKQCQELLEIAQVRFGIKGGAVQISLTPLKMDTSMNEAQVLKILLSAPERERADQVLYELAKGNLEVGMANRILASLALLNQFKKIKVDG
jgi:hypothetical protein